jgi:hypothetical protein
MFVLEADDALETVTPIKPSGPVLRRRHINKHLEHDRSNHWKLVIHDYANGARQGRHYSYSGGSLFSVYGALYHLLLWILRTFLI